MKKSIKKRVAPANKSTNKLCNSCRRTCKQAGNAIVAKCPRYYPFHHGRQKAVIIWKQMDLGL